MELDHIFIFTDSPDEAAKRLNLLGLTEGTPMEPMLFELPFHQIKPKDYPKDKQQPLHHKNGFQEITKVILSLPAAAPMSKAMQKVISHSMVEISAGASPSIRVEFDQWAKGKTESFDELIPLIIRW